jgi:hypothetical protein
VLFLTFGFRLDGCPKLGVGVLDGVVGGEHDVNPKIEKK